MAIDSETEKALEARADSIRTRRGEELRRARENRRYLDEDKPGGKSRRYRALMPLKGIFRFAEVES
ncbi:MAG: hypothetical protein CL534_10860 [Ahrensia sp.]|nr:hypothetical protein [Ahrensia sp.]